MGQAAGGASFPIVGIGASAGGLEAMEAFFKGLPRRCGMAFVVVQHLDPKQEGYLPELLRRGTDMEVLLASSGLKVEPNSVYVIPPNKSMTILDGALLVEDLPDTTGLRLLVDIFFRSLAENRKDSSVAIVLSGMGSDGSEGVKAIKKRRGVVLVQDPSSAKFCGMPQSAIASVKADLTGTPEALATALAEILSRDRAIEQESVTLVSEKDFERINALLLSFSGNDFSLYKKSTMTRRLDRRKSVHQIESTESYIQFLQENPSEQDILFKELLIGVTSFFRDPAMWKLLIGSVFPEMIRNASRGDCIRFWIPACSTGEEAYSYAMAFQEALEATDRYKHLSLQVFATDLDMDAIEKARKGVYPESINVDVSSERLDRFFVSEADGYLISPSIREKVVFATQNVIKDPPFTKLNLVSCRNMLIYMEQSLQSKLIALFNYSLVDNGIMVLGTSETLGRHTGIFDEVDGKLKVFRRRAQSEPSDLIDFPSSFIPPKNNAMESELPAKHSGKIQELAMQVLLQDFVPPSVLVNRNGDILFITGRTGRFLEPVAGKANWNIHAMARKGLREALPIAFRKALNSDEEVQLRNIAVGSEHGSQVTDVSLKRIESPEEIRGMLVIVFREPLSHCLPQANSGEPDSSASASGRPSAAETDLLRSQEELMVMREEMQISQEELKSANEELQSTNEELQSTNEELTTSKEELQSLNEELQTVNIELQSKVSDYSRANDDMKNLLNSTEIATLFLDKSLNIRRYTDPVTEIFKLREFDVGRPFTELSTCLQYPEISSNARLVLNSLTSIESSVATDDGRWFVVRIMPYRTLDDRIDGLVLTFVDVTDSKKLEIELQKANVALHVAKGDK